MNEEEEKEVGVAAGGTEGRVAPLVVPGTWPATFPGVAVATPAALSNLEAELKFFTGGGGLNKDSSERMPLAGMGLRGAGPWVEAVTLIGGGRLVEG